MIGNLSEYFCRFDVKMHDFLLLMYLIDNNNTNAISFIIKFPRYDLNFEGNHSKTVKSYKFYSSFVVSFISDLIS